MFEYNNLYLKTVFSIWSIWTVWGGEISEKMLEYKNATDVNKVKSEQMVNVRRDSFCNIKKAFRRTGE